MRIQQNHGTDGHGTLPALADPAKSQLFLWAVFIVIATGLSLAAGIRIALRIDLVEWWVTLAFLAGIAAADLGSGLIHWGADTWGRSDLPLIGQRFLVPFRVHHLNPDDFLRRRFLDTNGDVAGLTAPVLAALCVVPLDTSRQQATAVLVFALATCGALTNQIHQWAHMPSPPRTIRILQNVGVLLGPREHAAHHNLPYDGHYCITTGWCNRPLEAIGFFRRLERLVTRLTGVQPRDDERGSAAGLYAGRRAAQDV